MLEADKEYIKDVERQLANWRETETELDLWIKKHSVMHPDHEEKFRELNNARWKIKQLIKRKSRNNAYTDTE
jgi:hypothetical protein